MSASRGIIQRGNTREKSQICKSKLQSHTQSRKKAAFDVSSLIYVASYLARDRAIRYSTSRNNTMVIVSAVADSTTGEEHAGDGAEHDLDPYAVLFPWFVMAIGTLIYFCTTRYFHKVPYTAIMFLIGTLVGKSTLGEVIRPT